MANVDKIAAQAADSTAVGNGEEPTTEVKNLLAPAADKKKEEAVQPAAAVAAPRVSVRETTPVADAVAAATGNAEHTTRAKGTNTANALQEQWLQYTLGANPKKPQSTNSIIELQRTLIRLIETTVNLPDVNDFMQVSNYLIRLINEDKTGVFSGGAIFRHFDRGIVAPALTNNARFALDAYLLFANPDVRASHIGVYNLENSAKIGKTVQLRERFVAYFNRISGRR